jgi:hypothetical protein
MIRLNSTTQKVMKDENEEAVERIHLFQIYILLFLLQFNG